MSPRTRIRAAALALPVAVVIGALGVITRNWFVVVAMALVVVLQLVNYRLNRNRLR
jgi:uncharacterized protein (DUF58 family)